MSSPIEARDAPLNQSLDLIHYALLLYRAKWWIMIFTVLAGGLGAYYAASLPNVYKASVKVDIVDPGNPGGIAPGNRSGAESVDLVEKSFTLGALPENYHSIILSRLRSKKFTRYFLDKHNIYPLIFPKKWNSETQSWKGGFKLNKRAAEYIFENDIRTITENDRSQTLVIAIQLNDPLLAADLANLIVAEFNHYMRQITLSEISGKLEFLRAQLNVAKYIQTKQMLYRLIEVQEAAATIIKSEKNYALTILDPATELYGKVSPSRKNLTVTITLLVFFLSAFVVIGLDIANHIKSVLDEYGIKTGRTPLRQRKWSVRGRFLTMFFDPVMSLIGKRYAKQTVLKPEPKTKTFENKDVERLQHIQEEVDLLRYIYVIAHAKYLIIGVAIACGGLSYFHAKGITDRYMGTVRVDIRDIRDNGSAKPDSRRAQEAIALLEHSYVLETHKDNYKDVIVVQLKSHTFVEYFLEKHNIYQYIFKKHWDKKTQSWLNGFEPKKRWAQKYFKTEILGVARDPKTELVAIKINDENPKIASDLANLYVDTFNEYMRENTVRKTQEKIEQIEYNLQTTKVIEIEKMLFRLIEAHTAAAMLANARQDYVMEVLAVSEPAKLPYTPNRKLMIVLGILGGLLLSVSFIIFFEIAKDLRKEIKKRTQKKTLVAAD